MKLRRGYASNQRKFYGKRLFVRQGGFPLDNRKKAGYPFGGKWEREPLSMNRRGKTGGIRHAVSQINGKEPQPRAVPPSGQRVSRRALLGVELRAGSRRAALAAGGAQEDGPGRRAHARAHGHGHALSQRRAHGAGARLRGKVQAGNACWLGCTTRIAGPPARRAAF